MEDLGRKRRKSEFPNFLVFPAHILMNPTALKLYHILRRTKVSGTMGLFGFWLDRRRKMTKIVVLTPASSRNRKRPNVPDTFVRRRIWYSFNAVRFIKICAGKTKKFGNSDFLRFRPNSSIGLYGSTSGARSIRSKPCPILIKLFFYYFQM